MKLPPAFFAVAFLSGSLTAASSADIAGKVTLDGTPPVEIVIQPLMNDLRYRQLHPGEVPATRNFRVSADHGLADTFVYVKTGLEDKEFNLPNLPEPVLSLGFLPEPFVFGVMVNQKIKIRATDGVSDNVHAASSHPENSFNLAFGGTSQETERRFGAPELFIQLKGDVYNWKVSYIGVFDHPYFAVTDRNGAYRLTGLPPGKYTLEAFHRRAGRVSREITVGQGNQYVDFTLRFQTSKQ